MRYVKLIAEPWDIGLDGYQLGHFPPAGRSGTISIATRSAASGAAIPASSATSPNALRARAICFERRGRRPTASINFVACHDGFTLYDATAYKEKHNEANLEENRDGHNHNLSWNCGVEGPTDDPRVIELRERQMRNLLATLLLSQGVPMLLAGDEFGRTQRGNNNAYCQDNELSWIDWTLAAQRSWLTGVRPAAADLARSRARACAAIRS